MERQNYYVGLLELYKRLIEDPITHKNTIKGVRKMISKEYEKIKD